MEDSSYDGKGLLVERVNETMEAADQTLKMDPLENSPNLHISI